MASFEHTNTFLRTALVKDPFCLGDLGPEDVLRIESEFPNLFSSRTPRIPERKTFRPADGSPYAVPLLSRASATGPALPAAKNRLNERITPSGSCSRGPRCYPRPTSLATTDGNIGDPSNQTKPRSRNAVLKPNVPQVQFSAFGGSVVKHVSRLQSINSERESSDQLLNKYKDELSTSRRKLEEVTLALKEQQSQVSKRLSQHKIGDAKSISSSVPLQGAKLLEMASIKTPRGKYQFRDELKKQTQSMPKLSTKQRSPLHDRAMKAETTDLPRIKQVKFKQDEPDRDILKQHSKRLLAKARNAPGFIRPSFSNPGIMRTNLKSKKNRKQVTKRDQSLETVEGDVGTSHVREAERTDETNANDSPASSSKHIRGIDEETEPSLVSPSISEEDLTKASETPQWYSPLQIHNRKTSEEISAETVELQKLQTESTAKFEQLLFAKLLASRYENEGKFQKSQLLSHEKHVEAPPRASQDVRTHPSQYQTDRAKYRMQLHPIPPNQVSLEQRSILEKIAEELIRAEVLKCIHTEELNATVDVGIGTGSDPINCDTPENSKDNSHKLSTISEEVQVISTPDLTPPPPRAASRIATAQPNIQEIIADLEAEILRTPEITPPFNREIQSNRPLRENSKAANENCNDLTDCSSISDFVFSEILTIGAPKRRNLMKVNTLAVPPDMETPSVTPQQSEHVKAENVDGTSVSASRTPAPSTSASAVRFTLPDSIHRQRSASAHSSTSRETKTSVRRTSPRSKVDNLSSSLISETESRSSIGSSALRQICTEMVSDGEFLGVPYKSPGEVSWSLSLSPGRYLENEDETQSDCWIDSKDTFSEDLHAAEPSEGELRSRN